MILALQVMGIFFLGGCWMSLMLILYHVVRIKNLLTQEIEVLSAMSESKSDPSRTSAANLTSRLADIQQARFSPRVFIR